MAQPSVYDLLQRIDRKVNLLCDVFMPPRPRAFGLNEPIAIKLEERNGIMAHFIKNRQHMAAVPTGKGIVKQTFVATENGVEIFRGDVAFDAVTGVEQPPLPEFWAEVGAQVGRTLTYTRDDNTVSEPFSSPYEQVDNFTGPMVNPTDLAEAEQIDEVDADVRPTT